MANKFSDLKNAYNGLKSIKLNSADAEKVSSAVLNYNKKIEAYNKAVSDFVNIK